MRRHTLLAIVVIVAFVIPLLPQGSDKPSFEVASIKPNNSGDNRVMFRANGGRFTVAGATAKMLIQQAYRVRDFQLSGGPAWLGSDRFDIEAKPENVSDMTPERMPLLLQNLLVERFQLKTHKETKELPIYELVVAKDGPKLKSVPEPPRPIPGTPPGPPPSPGGPMPPGAFRIGRGEMIGSAIPFENFIQSLSSMLGRTVVNKTGLTGFFDVQMHWAPDPGETGPFGPVPGVQPPPPADPAGPSIFTALQEQAGLRLESSKGPVEVLVIDSIEKPSEN
ncbi:MAG TPA: TIGR03435 family protein [Nitrospiraceae bacterium]|nr:TIGR03435 family protein [Nitrospiraceae bacterium]